MRIFYGGAEAPTLRRRLSSAGASRFAVSYWHLRDRLPKSGQFPFAERFPEGAEILLDSGGFTANKRSKEFEDDFWIDYMDEYVELVASNLPALTYVTEFDFLDYSVDDLWALRFDVWSKIPEEMFLPVWHPEHGFDELVNLSDTYPQVAIPGPAVEDMGHRLPALANRYGVKFHGLAVTSEETIQRAGLSSVSSTGWVSPSRHGDRVVWDGSKLHRYSKKQKQKALDNHRNMLERENFDIEALEDEEAEELTRLTIFSMESWAAFLTRRLGVLGTSDVEEQESSAEVAEEEPAPSTPQVRNLPEPRTPSDRKLLPIMETFTGTKKQMTDDGVEEVETGRAEMGLRSGSARQCDSCYIRHACPEFNPGSNCAYDIPVEIKTKEQLVAAMTALLEMQGQRVLFSRFAEELEGGYPTEKVSSELDRFFELTKKTKDIQDNRDFLRISVEGRGEAGVLSRLFGDQAGQQMQALPQPLDEHQTNKLLGEVVDAEEVR